MYALSHSFNSLLQTILRLLDYTPLLYLGQVLETQDGSEPRCPSLTVDD